MKSNSPENRNDSSDFAGSFRKAIPYLNSIYTFMGSMALFGFCGWWLDKKYNTKPWWLIIGLLLGLAIGFYQFYKVLLHEEKKE